MIDRIEHSDMEKQEKFIDKFLRNQTKSGALLMTVVVSSIVIVMMIFIAIPLQNLISKLSLKWGTILAIVSYVIIIFWSWLRPKSFIFRGLDKVSAWRDLRVWATIFLGMQIVIYYVLK